MAKKKRAKRPTKKSANKPKPPPSDPTQAAVAAIERIIGGKLAMPSKKSARC